MARKYIPIDRGSGIDENPLRTVWIPLIMTDPLLFQATTNYAAVHLDLLQGRFNHPKTLMKKAETISMINRKIQCPEEATTNSLIGSIAMMAAMEVVVPLIYRPTLFSRLATETQCTTEIERKY